MNVVIFDFCGTLVNFETADSFIEFICDQTGIPYKKNKIYLLVIRIIGKIFRLFCDNYILEKRLKLTLIKGLSRSQINEYGELFYNQKIKNNLVIETMNALKNYRKRGIKIALVSAAYAPYLNPFAKENGVDFVITNEFLYDKHENFTGKLMNHRDCLGDEKVSRFYSFFKKRGLEELNILCSYGDSKSDLPILKEAQKGVIIIHEKPKFRNVYDFEEVYW